MNIHHNSQFINIINNQIFIDNIFLFCNNILIHIFNNQSLDLINILVLDTLNMNFHLKIIQLYIIYNFHFNLFFYRNYFQLLDYLFFIIPNNMIIINIIINVIIYVIIIYFIIIYVIIIIIIMIIHIIIIIFIFNLNVRYKLFIRSYDVKIKYYMIFNQLLFNH